MRTILVFTILIGGWCQLIAQTGWEAFAHATFKDHYIEEYLAYASLLEVDDRLAAIDGQEVTLKGYYIPVLEDVTIISKYPNESCFFCGDAGMETVAQVNLQSPADPPFKMDERITIRGRLRLNSTEWEYVSFIIDDAVIVSRKR